MCAATHVRRRIAFFTTVRHVQARAAIRARNQASDRGVGWRSSCSYDLPRLTAGLFFRGYGAGNFPAPVDVYSRQAELLLPAGWMAW